MLIAGAIGFALRGGIVLLTLPILILPTSVEVRLLLGSNIGSTGLTGGFYLLVAAVSAVTLLLALAVLYVLARCEIAQFGRFVNSHEPGCEHEWPVPGRLTPERHAHAVNRVFVVQSVALLAVLVAAVPLAAAIGQATINEVVFPSSADSIYSRIAGDVALPFVAWLVALVVIEAISAIWTRRVLASIYGLKAHARIGHHPLRAIAVVVLGWALFIGAVAVSVVVLSAMWGVVESVFLSTGLSTDIRDLVSALLVAGVFGAVFALALLLCGLVSTIRAGLWTLASLR